jgi:hypothetical protein
MKKQTAVEWLESIVKGMLENGHHLEDLTTVMDYIQEAKEIEKEQIINAHVSGFEDAYSVGEKPTGEEYYEKVYKSNKHSKIMGNKKTSKMKNLLSAQAVYDFLNRLVDNGEDLSNISVNYRHDYDSDVVACKIVEEDLFYENSNRLISIVFVTDDEEK